MGILEQHQILIPNNKTLYKLGNLIQKREKAWSGEGVVRSDVWKAVEWCGKDGYDLRILYSCVKLPNKSNNSKSININGDQNCEVYFIGLHV